MIEDCTALILAGGDSRRMGQDKATLQLDNRSLLEHVIIAMRQVFPDVIVSVRQPRAELQHQQVCDTQPDSGPLAGLTAGMARAQTRWVFAIACDMPFIAPVLVQYLASLRAGHQAVVPRIGAHPQPLAAYYRRDVLPDLQASLQQRNLSLRAALDKMVVRYVDETELRPLDTQLHSFFDLDTPQEFAAAAIMRK